MTTQNPKALEKGKPQSTEGLEILKNAEPSGAIEESEETEEIKLSMPLPFVPSPTGHPAFLPSLKSPEKEKDVRQLWQQVEDLAHSFSPLSEAESMPSWALPLDHPEQMHQEKQIVMEHAQQAKQRQMEKEQESMVLGFQNEWNRLEEKEAMYLRHLDALPLPSSFASEKASLDEKAKSVERNYMEIRQHVQKIEKAMKKQ